MKPVIAVTMGDPASIGPELCIKALSDPKIYDICRPVIIGDCDIIERAAAIEGMPQLKLNRIKEPEEGLFSCGTMDIIDMNMAAKEEIPVGEVSIKAGHAAFEYVKKAIDLALAHQADATVTNALNKEALNAAGHHFSGHTEIYAHYTHTQRYTMLLIYENMRIVHVSTHVSLRQACDCVTKERVLEVIRIAHQACLDLGIAHPRIGVAGLNPHCGENGLFGREEIDEITPAVNQALQENMDAAGPIPPDTVFSKARGGMYDIVVAMYHDQGHIPLKMLGFVYDENTKTWKNVSGVNITLGLPIIRTSVDHGTAFDQAGKGTASEASLKNAIVCAVRLAQSRA